MRKTYTLHVAGLERELPLCPVNEKMDIAAFIMFSDVELTIACAKALLEKLPEFDVIVTAEAKGIPLAYEMSRRPAGGPLPLPYLDLPRETFGIGSRNLGRAVLGAVVGHQNPNPGHRLV